MASKAKTIKEELLDATGVTTKRGEDDQDLKKRLVRGVNELSDGDFDKLSDPAVDWFNEAVTCVNDKKTLPAFPDEKEEAPASSGRSRRGAAKEEKEEKARAVQVGDQIIVTMKARRGEKTVEGEVVEIDDQGMFIQPAEGEEIEVPRDSVISMQFKDADAGSEEEETEGFKEGDKVIIITKREKEVTGTFLELDGDTYIIEVDGKEEEYPESRIKSISLAGLEDGKEEEEAEPKVGDEIKATIQARRGEKVIEGKVVEIDDGLLIVETANGEEEVDPQDEKTLKVEIMGKKSAAKEEKKEESSGRNRRGSSAAAKEEKKEPAARTRATKKDGEKSAPQRAKEIVCEDDSLTKDEVAKKLKSEGFEIKDNTLQLAYGETQKIIGILKELGRIKK